MRRVATVAVIERLPMIRVLHLAVGAALMSIALDAAAGSAAATLDALAVRAYDLAGAPDPAATVVFTGNDLADAEITAFPGNPFGGPGPYPVYNEGPVQGGDAFGFVLSLASVGDGAQGLAASSAYVNSDPVAMVTYASANAQGTAANDLNYSESSALVQLGGTSFVLAARSELVVTGDVGVGGQGGDAVATFTIAGPDPSADIAWSLGSGTRALSLVFRNPTDQAVTGVFTARLFAESIPEPGPAALLLAGLAVLGVRARNRSTQRAQLVPELA
jgi:hypothetical protein